MDNAVLTTQKFIRKILARDTVTVLTPSGPDSPLAPIKSAILKTILAMSENREPLPPPRCIHLINNMV